MVNTLHIFSFFVDGILAKDIGEELGLPIYLMFLLVLTAGTLSYW